MAKKITDYDYSLPIIEALIAYKTTNNQLLIRGINLENQIKGDYFVNDNQAVSRELLASFMASELDINVQSPILVNVSSELSKTFQQDFSGLQFGTEYKSGCYGIIRNQPLSEFQRLQVNQIFPSIFLSVTLPEERSILIF